MCVYAIHWPSLHVNFFICVLNFCAWSRPWYYFNSEIFYLFTSHTAVYMQVWSHLLGLQSQKSDVLWLDRGQWPHLWGNGGRSSEVPAICMGRYVFSSIVTGFSSLILPWYCSLPPSLHLGYANFGSDIGGYRQGTGKYGRTKELFVRWFQLGAFSPLMENGGYGEHRPWKYDNQTLEIYKK